MRALIAIALFTLTLFAQTAPLAIQTTSLPAPTLRKPYEQHLKSSGGVVPLRWTISAGALPPGLALAPSGDLTGIPTTPGTFRFRLRVTDSSRPPRTATHDFILIIPAALAIRWTQPPRLANDGVSGELELNNESGETLDLTVIVVAVNEVGKAFALAYQHGPQPVGLLTVPFGSSLPRGHYIVHVDAIGEFAPTLSIYRARLQTPQPLSVP